MQVLLISDLHLEEERPDISRAFFRFLQEQAQHADALYILGDFFEVWVGDDECRPLQVQVIEALRALSDRGIQVYFLHGNRDFLIGQQFAEEAGVQLLDDPTVVELGGQPTLLMHGDTLCTRDTEYAKFRAMVRNPQWQTMMLKRPLVERQTMARQLREMSMARNQGKQMEIMDVTPEEVERVMELHQVRRLIHGHTHRPRVHQLTVAGQDAKRYVLGDWDRGFWYIRIRDNQEPELLQQPFPES